VLDQTDRVIPETAFPGLTFAYRFRDGVAERIAPLDVSRALAEPGGWLWLHLALADPAARIWIEQEAPIPDRARAILLSEDDHLLLEPIAGGVAGVFADMLRECAGESHDLGRLRFALTGELVISGRRDALGAIARTLQSIDAGKRFPDAVALLEAIVEHFADTVATVVEELADTLDLIEDHLIDNKVHDEERRLGPARRTAVRLHRQLASLRLLFRRWSTPSQSELPSRLAEIASRLAQRLDGLDHEIASIQERARLLQDEIAARLAAETNRHLFALSVVTVILLPPTLVSGIFGMNVTDVPFTKDGNGFAWAAAVIVLSSIAVYAFMRWLRIMR
jgi:Mg2+ and Co2+ transporter CorA